MKLKSLYEYRPNKGDEKLESDSSNREFICNAITAIHQSLKNLITFVTDDSKGIPEDRIITVKDQIRQYIESLNNKLKDKNTEDLTEVFNFMGRDPNGLVKITNEFFSKLEKSINTTLWEYIKPYLIGLAAYVLCIAVCALIGGLIGAALINMSKRLIDRFLDGILIGVLVGGIGFPEVVKAGIPYIISEKITALN